MVGVAKKQLWQSGRRGIVEVWKVVDVVFLVGVAKKQPWQSGRRGIVEVWKSGRRGKMVGVVDQVGPVWSPWYKVAVAFRLAWHDFVPRQPARTVGVKNKVGIAYVYHGQCVQCQPNVSACFY